MSHHPQTEFSYSVKSCLLRHPKLKTVTALARDLVLARNTVSIAINHPTMLPTVKRRIAKRLNLKPAA